MFLPATHPSPGESQPGDHVLWFSQPAPDWNSALPIGNGRLGAMIFGGTARELFQLNDDTFWAGHPHDHSDPEAHTALSEIQRLLFGARMTRRPASRTRASWASPSSRRSDSH